MPKKKSRRKKVTFADFLRYKEEISNDKNLKPSDTWVGSVGTGPFPKEDGMLRSMDRFFKVFSKNFK